MFEVGQKIMYPMQGDGVIEGIEEQNETMYYKIRIPSANIKIRIPAEKAMQIGMRKPAHKAELEEVINRVGDLVVQSSGNWNIRYKENIERLRTGQLEEVTKVVKVLREQQKIKKLSLAENQLFHMAKQILIGEIVVSCEINEEKAMEQLANWLKS